MCSAVQKFSCIGTTIRTPWKVEWSPVYGVFLIQLSKMTLFINLILETGLIFSTCLIQFNNPIITPSRGRTIPCLHKAAHWLGTQPGSLLNLPFSWAQANQPPFPFQEIATLNSSMAHAEQSTGVYFSNEYHKSALCKILNKYSHQIERKNISKVH